MVEYSLPPVPCDALILPTCGAFHGFFVIFSLVVGRVWLDVLSLGGSGSLDCQFMGRPVWGMYFPSIGRNHFFKLLFFNCEGGVLVSWIIIV